jgi:hypothetical protein
VHSDDGVWNIGGVNTAKRRDSKIWTRDGGKDGAPVGVVLHVMERGLEVGE